MIPPGVIRNVISYLPIDHRGEGLGIVRPGDGVLFLGIPANFDSDSPHPYIQIVKDGRCVGTVNALDCSEIAFG